MHNSGDTSALAKLYHQEAGTGAVTRIVLDHPGTVFVSRLGILEKHSVLSGKVRTGEISAEHADLVRRRFRSDVRRRRFRIVALRLRHYQIAEALITAHGSTLGLRALDSLQLAVALDLYRHGVIEAIVTADKVMLRVAPVDHLPVINPEPAEL